MARSEFTRTTKREALLRSGKLCEASGVKYGHKGDERCGANLGDGVQFDHVQECREGGDNSLANCLSVCRSCHQYKTNRVRQECAKSDRLAGRKERPRSKWKWQTRPMDGTKASGIKKRFDGKVERR